ncbi:hypothetical protein [Stutzerimonas xanthomarina]|uniref:hypothetical protein n=1 Tax=Stutzerimonas xanthomarina TaxID=271420 RepID=UPI003AA82D68
MIKKGFQIDLENLEGAKHEILQEVSELRDAYMTNKSSYEGIRPVVVVIDGRSIPTWLPEYSENAVVIQLPPSPTEALMCEFCFSMSDEEVQIFLEAEEKIQPLREQLSIIDAAIDAILRFNESSQF